MSHGIPVIEDAATRQSSYRGRKIGSIAEVTCFSLYATKNIAAGEGGLISTNDATIAEAIENLRLMRRGDGSATTSSSPATRRTSPTSWPRSRSSSSTRSSSTARSAAPVRGLRRGGRRGSKGSSLSPATTATRTRTTSTSSASTPSGPAARGTSTSAGSPRRTSPRASTSSGAHADGLPRAATRSAAAPGRRRRGSEVLSAAVAGSLRRRHRGRDLRAAPGPRLVPMSRSIRVALTLLVTGLCTACPLEDRPRQDDRRARRSRPALLLPRTRDHGRDHPPDGVALAAAAAGEGRRGGFPG